VNLKGENNKMKLSDLRKFFESEASVDLFRKSIQNELRDYEKGSIQKGRSMPVTLVEDTELLMKNEFVSKLCLSCLNQELASLEVQYIADAILLSENVAFPTKKLREISESLTDPAVNGLLTEERLRGVLTQLSQLGEG
jgi:hypothetical protein